MCVLLLLFVQRAHSLVQTFVRVHLSVLRFIFVPFVRFWALVRCLVDSFSSISLVRVLLRVHWCFILSGVKMIPFPFHTRDVCCTYIYSYGLKHSRSNSRRRTMKRQRSRIYFISHSMGILCMDVCVCVLVSLLFYSSLFSSSFFFENG